MGAQNGAKKTDKSEEVIDVEDKQPKGASPKKTVKQESAVKSSPLNKNSKKTKNTKLTSDDDDEAPSRQDNDVLVDEKENNLASCYLKRFIISYRLLFLLISIKSNFFYLILFRIGIVGL